MKYLPYIIVAALALALGFSLHKGPDLQFGATTILPVIQGGIGTSTEKVIGGLLFSNGSQITQNGTSTLIWNNLNGFLSVGSSTPFVSFSTTASTTLATTTGTILATENQLQATSTAQVITFNGGNTQWVRLGGSATTISLIGFAPGGQVNLQICSPTDKTAGAVTFTSPYTMVWASAYTQTSAANHCDLVSIKAVFSTSTTSMYSGASYSQASTTLYLSPTVF